MISAERFLSKMRPHCPGASDLLLRAALDEAIAELRLLAAMGQADRVVGAYLADARMGPQGPEPVHFREVFRTRGPSNYAHGKQESAHV